jgi:very-short-patch-repair endonuclease
MVALAMERRQQRPGAERAARRRHAPHRFSFGACRTAVSGAERHFVGKLGELGREAMRKSPPSRLREGPGVGKSLKMPEWKPRNTDRARELRNAATPAERALWRYLARAQLGAKFSRQMPVGPFYADFLCRTRKLVVELDGFSHDLQPERDAARDRWFADHGYRVLRFTNEDVLRDPEAVAIAVREALSGLAHP